MSLETGGSPVPQGTRVKGIVGWWDTQEKAQGHEWRMGGVEVDLLLLLVCF